MHHLNENKIIDALMHHLKLEIKIYDALINNLNFIDALMHLN